MVFQSKTMAAGSPMLPSNHKVAYWALHIAKLTLSQVDIKMSQHQSASKAAVAWVRSFEQEFPFSPPGCVPVYSQSPPVGPFFSLSIPGDSGTPPSVQGWALPATGGAETALFPSNCTDTSQSPTCLLSRLLSLSSRLLSGRHRQRRDPPQHGPEQRPRQMALRQQEPVIAGMFD